MTVDNDQTPGSERVKRTACDRTRNSTAATLVDVITVPVNGSPACSSYELNCTASISGAASGGNTAGVGSGVGLGTGDCDCKGVGVAAGVGLGAGVGDGDTLGVAAGVGVGIGDTIGVGVGIGVGSGTGDGVAGGAFSNARKNRNVVIVFAT